MRAFEYGMILNSKGWMLKRLTRHKGHQGFRLRSVKTMDDMKLKSLDAEKAHETQGGQGFRLRSVKTMNYMKLKRLDIEKTYETQVGQRVQIRFGQNHE